MGNQVDFIKISKALQSSYETLSRELPAEEEIPESFKNAKNELLLAFSHAANVDLHLMKDPFQQ